MSRMREISEKTLVPISFLAILAGGILWIASMSARVDAASEKIRAMETKQDMYIQNIVEIRDRLARIEGKLEKR